MTTEQGYSTKYSTKYTLFKNKRALYEASGESRAWSEANMISCVNGR